MSCGESLRELGLFGLALGASCVLFFSCLNGRVQRRRSQVLLRGAQQKGEGQRVQVALRKIPDEYKEKYFHSGPRTVEQQWKPHLWGYSKLNWTWLDQRPPKASSDLSYCMILYKPAQVEVFPSSDLYMLSCLKKFSSFAVGFFFPVLLLIKSSLSCSPNRGELYLQGLAPGSNQAISNKFH